MLRSNVLSMSRLLAVAFLAAVLLPAPAMAQDDPPRTSYAGAPDGEAAAFVGEWSAFRPGGERTTLLRCSSPVTLSVTEGGLQYQIPAGALLTYALSAEDGRTRWAHAGPDSQVVVWVGPDTFNMHPLTASGEPDWLDTLVHHRCPPLPRQSHAGAPDGMAAPFAGDWALYFPSPTGSTPDELLASCDVPVRIDATSDTTIHHDDPEAQPVDVRLEVHDGHTDWIMPDTPYPWEVVWIDENRFHAHLISFDGTTDWRSPMIYARCAARTK